MTTIEFLRQFRVGEYAIFDFAVSFLGIYLLSPLLSRACLKLGFKVPKRNWLFLTLPISILAHLISVKITPMTQDFLDPHGHYFVKIIIVGSLVLGLTKITKVKKINTNHPICLTY